MINFTGCYIWDAQGVERIPIEGEYNSRELSSLLKDYWISYFECHQCGRFDYCKFVERTEFPDKARDIQCGVAVTALQALINRCMTILESANSEQLQHFLDGAYHFTQFIRKSEIQTGIFLSESNLNYYGTLVPLAFSQIVDLRQHLTKFSYEMSVFPQFHSRQSVLLVEGQSEKAFIERLKHSRLADFLYITVETYGGKGNRKPTKMQMLLERYSREGYVVYIQGDADGGNPKDTFSRLVDTGILSENTFAFKYDFESAIPAFMLYEALIHLGYLKEVTLEAFEEVLDTKFPVGPVLKDEYSIELDSIKIELAETIADFLNESLDWWDDQQFMSTELGQFIKFLQSIQIMG